MGSEAVWSEAFDYDEATFYRYFAVHMGPHEASLASDLLGQAVVYLLLTAVLYVGPIVGLAAGRSIQVVMGDMVGALGVPLLLSSSSSWWTGSPAWCSASGRSGVAARTPRRPRGAGAPGSPSRGWRPGGAGRPTTRP